MMLLVDLMKLFFPQKKNYFFIDTFFILFTCTLHITFFFGSLYIINNLTNV